MRGVNHWLEISGNLYKKPEISYTSEGEIRMKNETFRTLNVLEWFTPRLFVLVLKFRWSGISLIGSSNKDTWTNKIFEFVPTWWILSVCEWLETPNGGGVFVGICEFVCVCICVVVCVCLSECLCVFVSVCVFLVWVCPTVSWVCLRVVGCV